MKKASLILSVVVITTLMMTSCGERDKEVKIGDQIWMAENLNVDKFRNGDPIPHAKTDEEWIKAGEEGMPAWCYYDNDEKMGAKYGKLYNWYAVNDSRGLAPKGWEVPSDAEWTQLTDFVGSNPGTKLKAKSGWSRNGTDDYGFSALPGGVRSRSGKFGYVGNKGYWWSSTETSAYDVWHRGMHYKLSGVSRGNFSKSSGFSVRCVRDF